MNLDFRTMDPKPFMEIYPVTIQQSAINQQVILDQIIIDIAAPMITAYYPAIRPSYETSNEVDMSSFGSVEQAPLGSIVHARSGDKANNSNIGFFVRHEDEYLWLSSFLTVQCLKMLFGDDWVKGDENRRVERCEFPNLLAVHL
jgi:hypothetical protein